MYIEVENYSKVIKRKEVLKDISLTLEKGKIYGFVGHNGSRKTMLFRAICGFIKPTKGSVKILGKPVTLNEALPVDIGLILETPGFIPNYTGLENLEYLASIKNKTTKEQILSALEQIGLLEAKDEKVKKYSLGMKQKLAIAQSFMEDQELLILDEPTNGLDKKSVRRFRDIMQTLRDQGKTILLASHNEADIKTLSDEIFELSDGELSSYHEEEEV